MKIPGRLKLTAWVLTLWAAGLGLVLIGVQSALAASLRPLFPWEFTQAAPQGFGDRGNSTAWAMQWWKGKLYVGTLRNQLCWETLSLAADFPALTSIYPPRQRDADCTPSPTDLPMQAEIWRWTPETNNWERVYQSPGDVEIPGFPGKYTARDIGFRGMLVFTEPDGTEALYVTGVSPRTMYSDKSNLPPPRLLRSTDGATFEAVPQDAGTFLGDLDKDSLRSGTVYNGRMYLTAGTARGEGVLIESQHPAGGNDHFRPVTPPEMTVWDAIPFNGFLYLGVAVPFGEGGFSVVKTDALGTPPYTFTPVITSGGYRKHPSRSVVSFQVYNSRLYVGTNAPAELYRINPDDSWDLIVGEPRKTPAGWKYPLSGLDAGFGWPLNVHMYRMQAHDGVLYVATLDMSRYLTEQFPIPKLDELLRPQYGFDLYRTLDGQHFTPITINGFGDEFQLSARTFASTPYGLFLGTGSYWYGLRIWRGVPGDLYQVFLPLLSVPHPSLLTVRGSGQINPDVSPASINRLILPDETADEAALATLVNWRSIPTYGNGIYQQFDSHDRETGEPAPLKLVANGNRDMNNFICASADARIKRSLFVPYTFDLESCPEDYVRGFVIARVEGSGHLVRLRISALSWFYGWSDRKILRLYVDDATTPFIQVPLADALDGSAGEVFAPPFGASTPDNLVWYYPVVFSKKLIVAVDRIGPFDLVYHQTNVVLDAMPSSRVPAASRLPARDDARSVLGALENGPVEATTVLLPATTVTLEPSVPTTIANLGGPATIHLVRVRVAFADTPLLDDVDVSVGWDGAPPAINHSLAMLFAAALNPPTTSSLALAGTISGDDVILTLRLPMPFADRSLWVMTNRGEVPVTLEVAISGEAALPPEPWGHLHTEVHTTVGPTTESYHPIAEVTGRGRYVGTCLMLEGHQLPPGTFWADGFNFLEGDVRARIDGKLAMPGTGTEGYFNSTFYFNRGEFGTPFAQVWGIVKDTQGRLEHGKVSACRWHVLGDTIAFQSSLKLDYEIGPGVPSLLDRYQSLAFFYR